MVKSVKKMRVESQTSKHTWENEGPKHREPNIKTKEPKLYNKKKEVSIQMFKKWKVDFGTFALSNQYPQIDLWNESESESESVSP